MENILLLSLVLYLALGLVGVGGSSLDGTISSLSDTSTIIAPITNTLPTQTQVVSPTIVPTQTSFPIQQDTTNSSFTTSSCVVNYKNAPTQDILGRKIAQACQENFPKIVNKLGNNSVNLPVTVIFSTTQDAPGVTSGSNITLSSSWYTKNPDDIGAFVHELVHVVQAYPAGSTTWLTEGIADYMRYWLGYQNTGSFAHCSTTETYTIGYWCGAAFLQYIEKTYDKDIVTKIDTALRNGTYADSLFTTYTGKNLSQLWSECKNFDCKS